VINHVHAAVINRVHTTIINHVHHARYLPAYQGEGGAAAGPLSSAALQAAKSAQQQQSSGSKNTVAVRRLGSYRSGSLLYGPYESYGSFALSL
jgi:hypothetical protein